MNSLKTKITFDFGAIFQVSIVTLRVIPKPLQSKERPLEENPNLSDDE